MVEPILLQYRVAGASGEKSAIDLEGCPHALNEGEISAICGDGEFLVACHDDDGDDYAVCDGACDPGPNTCGECNDEDSKVFPTALEVCNAVDDDCDGSVDEDKENGVDGDGDTIASACDNCPADSNVDQKNSDSDRFGDACDNCPEETNESQHDLDGDAEGDECDTDDGVVLFEAIGNPTISWQDELEVLSYNLYRGSLEVLLQTGVYSQDPGSNPYADRYCELGSTSFDDTLEPLGGEAFYWLVTGEWLAGESSLGDGTDVTRPNDNPCP